MKAIKEKKEAFPIYPIEVWSVEKYGVKLNINPGSKPEIVDENTEVSSSILLYDGSSIDVEDDGQGNFVGLGAYCPARNTCFYWSDWELAKKIFIPKFIAHNGVSDTYKLKQWGFDVTEEHLIWDTQLIGHYIDSTRKKYGLKHLAKMDLGAEWPSYEDICGKGKDRINLTQVPLELCANYNACDAYWTYRLYEMQKRVLDKWNA